MWELEILDKLQNNVTLATPRISHTMKLSSDVSSVHFLLCMYQALTRYACT